MRVISGKARGRRLNSVAGMTTRPTTDRVKESLFNIISNQIPDCSFLDLFAGNGGIGIEALSRGAQLAVFIDKDPGCCKVIKNNLATTNLENGEVYTKDVFVALTILEKKQRTFDIIFMDPPYAKNLVSKALKVISKSNILKPDGLLIAEYGRKEEIPKEVWKLNQVREEVYGDTIISFYRYKGDISEG